MVASSLVVLYIARGFHHPGDRASLGEQKLKFDQQLMAKTSKKGQTIIGISKN